MSSPPLPSDANRDASGASAAAAHANASSTPAGSADAVNMPDAAPADSSAAAAASHPGVVSSGNAATAGPASSASSPSSAAAATSSPAAPSAASSSSSSGFASVAAAVPSVPSRPTDEPSAQSVTWHVEPAADGSKAGVLGCAHYARACLIRAPCCPTFYTCRLCHDEAPQADVKLEHTVDRRTISEMVCMRCIQAGRGARVQPIGPRCVDCDQQMAAWYCSVCRLFDDDASKRIFHCDGCGICRRGGAENFQHCDTCCVCYTRSHFPSHVCVADATKRDCPICCCDMFAGREVLGFLRCGHALHQACMRQLYASRASACPLCKKSLFAPDPARIAQLDALIAACPMPADYAAWKSHILCNDCGTKGIVPWRVDYHKCSNVSCGSYNTDVLKRITPEDGEAGSASSSAPAAFASGAAASGASAAAAGTEGLSGPAALRATLARMAALVAEHNERMEAEEGEDDDEYEDGEDEDDEDEDDEDDEHQDESQQPAQPPAEQQPPNPPADSH